MPARAPLILSSSQPSGEEARVERPRNDFDVLAGELACPVSVPGPASAPVALLEGHIRLDVSQAARARRADASAYISLSERVGIPLSLLGPRAPHIVIAHLLTSPEKRRIARLSRWLARPDMVLVFSQAQLRYLIEEAGVDPGRAGFISDKVDGQFFKPAPSKQSDYVVGVGRERRDYPTLIAATRGLGLRCVIVPGSTWSRRGLEDLRAEAHVEIRQGLSYPELRRLYQGARVVVVPVKPGTDYAAGVNTLLEAMACGRPVVVSDTPGLAGYVRDGSDGRTVQAGAPSLLRAVIQELLSDEAQAGDLAREARRTVERCRTTEHFASTLAQTVATLV